MAKAKTKRSTKKTRVTMPTVLSFRITETQEKTLKAIFEKQTIFGVKSLRQYARKIVCDFIGGKLDYADEADRTKDSSLTT